MLVYDCWKLKELDCFVFMCPPTGLFMPRIHSIGLLWIVRQTAGSNWVGNAWPQLANVPLFVSAKVTLRKNCIPREKRNHGHLLPFQLNFRTALETSFFINETVVCIGAR